MYKWLQCTYFFLVILDYFTPSKIVITIFDLLPVIFPKDYDQNIMFSVYWEKVLRYKTKKIF